VQVLHDLSSDAFPCIGCKAQQWLSCESSYIPNFTVCGPEWQSPRAKPASGAPLLSKLGNLLIREILVVTSVYAHTVSGGAGGKSQDNPTGGGESHLYLVGNRAELLVNRHFFLAGNHMTSVAFEKEVF